MSVTVRPYRRGGWEVDIRVVLPDDSEHRERRKAPLSSKSAAQRSICRFVTFAGSSTIAASERASWIPVAHSSAASA